MQKNGRNKSSKRQSKNDCTERIESGKGSKFDRYDRRRGSHDNDPSWYAANPELLRDAATLSFPYAVGSAIPVAEEGTFSDLHWNAMAQPGIMALDYSITPGISHDATSAVNVAAINLYSYVRHANSGHTNYESADLMQYVLCMDWLYSWYAELVRAYGVARTYSFKNRYMPKIYLQALGFDADDIINNLANLRYYINYLCVRLGAFAVPSNFSYMARHIWMSSHIWADAPGNRFQAYTYRLGDYGCYEPYAEETGGRIKRLSTSDPIDFAGIDQITSAMMDPIMTNEDFGIMSGDILKAFGTNIVSLSPIAEDYTVLPEFNLEVLEQIHNTMVGVAELRSIQQENGVLVTEEVCNLNNLDTLLPANPFKGIKTYLDMFSEYPDPGAVMVASRNMISIDKSDVSDLKIEACGSEVISRGKIFVYNYEGGQLSVDTYDVDYITHIRYEEGISEGGVSEYLNPAFNIRALIEQFAYHPPFIYVFEEAIGGDITLECLGKCWDTTNITEISDVTLRKLHDTAIMSQLNVPSMGAFALSR